MPGLDPSPNHLAYYEHPEYEHVPKNRGIRTGQYNLMHYYELPEEFESYDLQNDLGEVHNLYGGPCYAALTKQLRSRLDELRKETGDIVEAAWRQNVRRGWFGTTGLCSTSASRRDS